MKMRQVGNYVYFLTGPFSQWFPSKFKQSMEPGGKLLTFNCAEQYMMAAKAHLFGDKQTFDAIMERHPDNFEGILKLAFTAPDEAYNAFRDVPTHIKKLGRLVKNFDPVIWDEHAVDCVFVGNWAKFTQDEYCAGELQKYNVGTKFVEGAHYDPIWGVGLAWDDPLIEDEANWKGKNQLGDAIKWVNTRKSNLPLNDRFDEWSRQIVD